MKKNIQKLIDKIEKAEEDLEKARNECPHVNTVEKCCGDRGNFDPSNDSYWTEYTCKDCGKFWSVEK